MGLFGFGNKKKTAEEEAAALEQRKQEERAELIEKQRKEHEGLPWPTVMPINLMKNKDDGKLSSAEDPISAERKDEIGSLIYQPDLKADDVKDLDDTELLFVLDTHDIFNRKAALQDYEKNHRVMYNELLRRMHGMQEFYMLYDKATGYPLLDGGVGLVYLNKEHAVKAAEMYAGQFRQAVPLTRPGEDAAPLENGAKPLQLFDYLYYLGIENVLVDNGWYKVVVKRSEISAPPTWNSDASKIPPAAPALSFAMVDFVGEAKWKVKYDKREEVLKKKMDRINALIPKQKFVLPMTVVNKETGAAEPILPAGQTPDQIDQTKKEIKCPMIKLNAKAPDGTVSEQMFLPIFTDLFEYSKAFAKSEFRPVVLEHGKLLELLKPVEGYVINPRGQSIVVPKSKALELAGVTPTQNT